MKTSFLFFVALTFGALTFLYSSCDDLISDPAAESQYWKLTSSEYWGVSPSPNSQSPEKKFSVFPFNIAYDGGAYIITYTGEEFNITRTDKAKDNSYTSSITYTWSAFPGKIDPDKDFSVTYESKGTGGNGIMVTKPVFLNQLNSWNQPGSFRDGAKTATMKISKPDNDPNHQKIKFVVSLSSGAYYYMEWWYIYEWVP